MTRAELVHHQEGVAGSCFWDEEVQGLLGMGQVHGVYGPQHPPLAP